MATLGRDTSPSPGRKRNGFARKCERCCCGALSYFPLLFVYGLTSWALWVGIQVGSEPTKGYLNGTTSSIVTLALYLLADISYTVAVFVSPGSPLDPVSPNSSGYSSLPTHETDSPRVNYVSITGKSSGRPRYCKKCQCVKPDRAHHCSSCGRCVLKMDHHCPWLATCVGLHNYKAFMLFLIYTSLLCWTCFLVCGEWVWNSLSHVDTMARGTLTVNIILLAVLAGIIGLVLSGFTGWHIYLAATGQTTIECLEKTRYLSPVKKSMEQQIQRANHRQVNGNSHSHGGEGEQSEPLLDQLKEIHANALPGITRPEEGEERNSNSSTPVMPPGPYDSPARESLRRSYVELEEQRERDRYQAYLDEKDSERLPHAFHLGWRRNLRHLFGQKWWLWPVPVCNTTGDGWKWDVSEEWLERRDIVSRQRVERQRQAEQQWRNGSANGFAMASSPMSAGAGRHYNQPPAPGDRQPPGMGPPSGSRGQDGSVQMQNLSRSDEGDDYDTSSDEEERSRRVRPNGSTRNWNDIPDNMVRSSRRPRSTSRRKGD